MRKVFIAIASLAIMGAAVPVATSSAQAETVIIKKGHGHHYGWHHARRHERVVIRRHVHHSHRGPGIHVGINAR